VGRARDGLLLKLATRTELAKIRPCPCLVKKKRITTGSLKNPLSVKKTVKNKYARTQCGPYGKKNELLRLPENPLSVKKL